MLLETLGYEKSNMKLLNLLGSSGSSNERTISTYNQTESGHHITG
jgi:hypothetical protein